MSVSKTYDPKALARQVTKKKKKKKATNFIKKMSIFQEIRCFFNQS